METNTAPTRIHPLIATAAASVILVSLVGVAAITGIIPNSHSSGSPVAIETAAVPAPAPVAVSAMTPNVEAPAQTKLAASSSDAETVKRSASTTSAPPQKSYAPRPVKTAEPQPRNYEYREPVRVAQAPAICYDCGRVESVNAVQSQAAPSGLGVVAGGVIGGLLGNQVGGGNGRKIATVAGAVGGGYAGNEIEKRTRSQTTYEVRVRMEDGSVRTFPYNNQPNWSSGDRIRVVDGYLRARA